MSEDTFHYEGKILAGKYRIHRRLAAGGMGEVFLAEHIRLGEPRAIKVIRENLLSDPSVRQRFLREIEMTHKVSRTNDHIVSLFDDYGFEQGVGYYVMEYLEGKTLQECINEVRGPLGVERSTNIALDLCRAMEPIHEAGVVHRDLKPANIFLLAKGDRADFVKIVDFGIARSTANETGLTGTGVWLGTLSYMSPEQLNWSPVGQGDSGQAVLDGRTDIYALGCILFQMLTGRKPFINEQPGTPLGINQMMMAHLYGPIPKASALHKGVPEALDRVIEKALAKEREDRFPTMGAFRGALLQARDEAARALRETKVDFTAGYQGAFVDTVDVLLVRDGDKTRPSVSPMIAPSPGTEVLPFSAGQIILNTPAESVSDITVGGPTQTGSLAWKRASRAWVVPALLVLLLAPLAWWFLSNRKDQSTPRSVGAPVATPAAREGVPIPQLPRERTQPLAFSMAKSRSIPMRKRVDKVTPKRRVSVPRTRRLQRRARLRPRRARASRPKPDLLVVQGPPARPKPKPVVRRSPAPRRGQLKCAKESGLVTRLFADTGRVLVNLGGMHGVKEGGRACLYQHAQILSFVSPTQCQALTMVSSVNSSTSTLIVARRFGPVTVGLRVCLVQ